MNRMLIVSILAVACTDANQLRASQDSKAASTHDEFVSEIIPIKYARAEEIASVLNGTNAMATELKNRLQLTINLSMLDAEIKRVDQRRIVADERSNSLSVWASPSDFETIKDLIAQLDVALAQVLVEGVILRLPLNDSDWKRAHPRSPLDPCPILSKLTHSSVLPEGRFVSSSASNGFGERGSQLSYVARFSGDLDTAKDALATNIGVRILQRPRIQTSTGVTAELLVTGNYPVYAAYYEGGSSCGCVSSLQRLRTNGSAIDLTFLVSKDGAFLTDIRQVVDMLTGSVFITNVGDVPITKRKESEAHIAVRDRETIVLGGLIETVREPIFSGVRSFDRIPGVSDFLITILTYPRRKVSYEIVALIRPTMLPVPELAANSRMPLVSPADAKVKAEELQRLQSTEKDTRALEHGK